MMLVGLCPLAKIFLPYFHVYDGKDFNRPVETVTTSQLMKNPDRIYKEEFFSIAVKREVGGLNFIYNIPRQIPDTLIRNWLSNPNVQETDCYGIVEMPLDQEAQAAMAYYVTNSRNPDKLLMEQVAAAREQAKTASLERVLGNIRRVNHAMRRQYELNEEQKLGDFIPSPVEYLCAYALAEEQTRSAAEEQAVKDKFKMLMAETRAR